MKINICKSQYLMRDRYQQAYANRICYYRKNKIEINILVDKNGTGSGCFLYHVVEG